jgi:hypothetical protein
MAHRLTTTAIRKGVKICRTCRESKQIVEFIKDLKKAKWLPADCLECERQRRRKLYKMQRSANARERNHKNGINRDDKPMTCEECGSSDQICLDHCHITGLPRGWLCSKCNTILGFADDNPERLRGLADYIEKFYTSKIILKLLRQREEEDALIYLPI